MCVFVKLNKKCLLAEKYVFLFSGFHNNDNNNKERKAHFLVLFVCILTAD